MNGFEIPFASSIYVIFSIYLSIDLDLFRMQKFKNVDNFVWYAVADSLPLISIHWKSKTKPE